MTQPRRGGQQPLVNFREELGYPQSLTTRTPSPTPAVEAALQWLREERPAKQNQWPALMLAVVGMAEELTAAEGISQVADVLVSYPPEVAGRGGRAVNTLNLTRPNGDSVKLRAYYNQSLFVIRNLMLREHPSNAAHATQSWTAYAAVIKMICALTPEERRAFAEAVWLEGVLRKTERQIAAVKARAIRPFEHVLSNMPTTASGVRGGAILQGLAFGYLRADSPNLILESHKVNTGASRVGMLGDVDGFRGQEPELAAEVKDLRLDETSADEELTEFLEDIVEAPNATALVICTDITQPAREAIEARGVTVLTKADLARRVSVWDQPKQHEALRATEYYLGRIQKSSAAVAFLRDWLLGEGLDVGLGVDPDLVAESPPPGEATGITTD